MNNIIESKSFEFSIRIVKLYKYLIKIKREHVLAKQILRSGTSICANINEAIQAQSKNDFIYKMNIALKEAAETKYWIRLLTATDYLKERESLSLLNECIEIEKILYNIIRTSKSK